VCLSTGGPGATHLITGLYDAKLDHAPVLAICGRNTTSSFCPTRRWIGWSPTGMATCARSCAHCSVS
jgi:hypothetical protein